MSSRGQFNFVWLFAIIAGGAILFLAIYGAMQFSDTAQYQSDTEIAKSISILTDPLQAGFSEGSTGRIEFREETRINNFCYDDGFGRNDISVASRPDADEDWNLAGGATSIHNKYIFSAERSDGLDYYVFSKPFEFPYKVADLIFLTSDSYCFANAPDEIVDEVINMNLPNVEAGNCTGKENVRVCFGFGNDCDMTVYGTCGSGCDSSYDTGKVERGGAETHFVGNLMWAAIFSDRVVYECNVKRLLYRTGIIAVELMGKVDLMDARGCDSNLKPSLSVWASATGNASSRDLSGLNMAAKSIDVKNDKELCGVW